MTFLSDIGGMMKSSGVGLNDILGIIGGLRGSGQSSQEIGENPAIAQLLALDQRRKQLERAITDEQDPLRRRIEENNLAELQNFMGDSIRKLEQNVNRRIASGGPALGGGILTGGDPRRRDEFSSKLINDLVGSRLPIAARSQALEQLGAGASALGSGAGLASVTPGIQNIITAQRTKEQGDLRFRPQQEALQGITALFNKLGQGQTMGAQQAALSQQTGGQVGGAAPVNIFSNTRGDPRDRDFTPGRGYE